MIKINYSKIAAFFKTIWNGIVGISLEICLTLLFILIGFLVCVTWWGILIR